MARWVLLSALGMGAGLLAAEPQAGHPVGHEKFTATPERPVGWLGDWHGRFSGAHDFPLEWAAPREWTDPPEAGSNILWKTAQALEAYDALWRSDALHVRYRALQEMSRVLGAQAAASLCKALRHKDPALRTLAVSLGAGIAGEAASSKFAGELADLSPDRPAKDVVAVYARALATGQETETILRRLGEVGDVQAINLAASCLNKSELEATIVESITRIGPVAAEKDPSATVAALQKAQEEVRDAGRRNAIDSVVQALIAKHGDKAVPVPSADGDKDLGLDL